MGGYDGCSSGVTQPGDFRATEGDQKSLTAEPLEVSSTALTTGLALLSRIPFTTRESARRDRLTGGWPELDPETSSSGRAEPSSDTCRSSTGESAKRPGEREEAPAC